MGLMAEFTNIKGAPLRSAVFHILLHESLVGLETTGEQLAPVSNMIVDGGTSVAQVEEKMITEVFASANDFICLPYSQLGIVEGGEKSVTIEKTRCKERKIRGIMFKVITNTSISPAKSPPPRDHPFKALTRAVRSGINVPGEVV